MASTFIAGYDGSDASAAALRFAGRLSAALRADLVVAAVHGGALPSDHPALEGLGPATRHITLPAESPARELRWLAEHEGAALLVVGHTRRGVRGRLQPGSPADRLLHGAPCPIAVVPAQPAPPELRTVAVAYDGRGPARDALAVGCDLAVGLGARLVVVGVHDPGLEGVSLLAGQAIGQDIGARRGAFAQRVEEAARDAGEGAIDVEPRVLSGSAGPAIVDGCADADLLVLGSSASGPVRRVLAGTVARHVADHARQPVLVVPRDHGKPALREGFSTVQGRRTDL